MNDKALADELDMNVADVKFRRELTDLSKSFDFPQGEPSQEVAKQKANELGNQLPKLRQLANKSPEFQQISGSPASGRVQFIIQLCIYLEQIGHEWEQTQKEAQEALEDAPELLQDTVEEIQEAEKMLDDFGL